MANGFGFKRIRSSSPLALRRQRHWFVVSSRNGGNSFMRARSCFPSRELQSTTFSDFMRWETCSHRFRRSGWRRLSLRSLESSYTDRRAVGWPRGGRDPGLVPSGSRRPAQTAFSTVGERDAYFAAGPRGDARFGVVFAHSLERGWWCRTVICAGAALARSNSSRESRHENSNYPH
jgi:hypothetical protein